MLKLCLIISLSILIPACQKNSYSEQALIDLWETKQVIHHNNAILQSATNYIHYNLESDCKMKVQFIGLVEASNKVRELSQETIDDIQRFQDSLISLSGGFYSEKEAKEKKRLDLIDIPKGLNRPITTQKAPKIILQIQSLKQTYLTLIDEMWADEGIQHTIFSHLDRKQETLDSLEVKMPIFFYEKEAQNVSNVTNWTQYNLHEQPLAVVVLILEKLKNDVRQTEQILVQFLAQELGRVDWTNNAFGLASVAPNYNIRIGETFESQLILCAYTTDSILSVEVNGDTLPIYNGRAYYTTIPRKIGEHTFNPKITIKNPLTGYAERYSKEFHYKVNPNYH